MIFFTALTYDDAYVHQYRYLLESLRVVYPAARPILLRFTPFPDETLAELGKLHPNFLAVDGTEAYDPAIGFDTNLIAGLKRIYRQHRLPLVVADADVVVCRSFDELVDPEIDVTQTTRGFVENEFGRQDICFGISIFSNANPAAVEAYLDELLRRSQAWHTGEETPWFEIQTEMNNVFLEASGELLEAYPAKAYEDPAFRLGPRSGVARCGSTSVRLRTVDFIELGCSYPPRYGEALAIHYKREKSASASIYRRYCLRRTGRVWDAYYSARGWLAAR